jgi:sugar phosphate isomerase/epimerase
MPGQPDKVSLKDRIGISSHVSPADYEELAALALHAGFPVFELSVGNFGCSNPLWPRTCTQAERAHIRQLLAPFSVLILRATSDDLNIANINPGQRAEAVRQYLECVDFALDIGARVVSFRPGTQVWGFIAPPETVAERNTDFATQAAEYVSGRNLTVAFRTVAIAPDEMTVLLGSADNGTFGGALDIDVIATADERAVSTYQMMESIRQWIGALRGRIAVVHLSGVHQRWHPVRLAGCPFAMNNCVDYGMVLEELDRADWSAPLVLGINGHDPASIIRSCITAREELLKLREDPR